ncbi:MAG: transcriptional repressor [Candidatus Bipolaricaulota bacterium]
MSNDWRWTRQRRKVLEALTARDDHPTAEDVYRDLRAQGEPVSLATVYRTLRSLEQEDLARALHGAGADRFDARMEPHYHLTCDVCGHTVDVSLPYESSLDEAARGTGLEVRGHVLLFLGRCPSCTGAGEE